MPTFFRTLVTRKAHPDAHAVSMRLRASGALDSECAPGMRGPALFMGDHLARSVRGISCAPPARFIV